MVDTSRQVDFGGEDLVVRSMVIGSPNPNQAGVTTIGSAITLAAGTTTASPILFTSGTNLTTAAAGAMEYDGTAFYATAAASARQVIDTEQYAFASADSATYNATGLDQATTPFQVFTTTTGNTTNGAVALIAGKKYYFEGIYNLTNTGTTSHTWATLFGGNATFTNFQYQVFGNSSGTANQAATGGLSGFSLTPTVACVTTAASTSATEQVTIELVGALTVNAGGTLIPQMQASARPGASGTPGVIVKAGSFFRIWEISTSATVGNWS